MKLTFTLVTWCLGWWYKARSVLKQRPKKIWWLRRPAAGRCWTTVPWNFAVHPRAWPLVFLLLWKQMKFLDENVERGWRSKSNVWCIFFRDITCFRMLEILKLSEFRNDYYIDKIHATWHVLDFWVKNVHLFIFQYCEGLQAVDRRFWPGLNISNPKQACFLPSLLTRKKNEKMGDLPYIQSSTEIEDGSRILRPIKFALHSDIMSVLTRIQISRIYAKHK